MRDDDRRRLLAQQVLHQADEVEVEVIGSSSSRRLGVSANASASAARFFSPPDAERVPRCAVQA